MIEEEKKEKLKTDEEKLKILQEERRILIEKTKSGAWIGMSAIIPSLIAIYLFISTRQPIVSQTLGDIINQIIELLLFGVIAIGSVCLVGFVLYNFWRYYKMEKKTNQILENIKI